MKKLLLTSLASCLYTLSFGQNVFPSSGNVGIGTTTPGANLVVNGKARVVSNLSVGTDADGPGFEQVYIAGTNPTIGFNDVTQGLNQKLWEVIVNGGRFRILSVIDGYGGIQEAFVITRSGLNINTTSFPNGNVGIGTSDTKGYKFAVNGDAIFTKIKVKLFSAWPDHVFAKGYQLPPLAEVEKYIQKNRHLEGVPPAAEVEKEGVDVAQNQAALLKKIEELTLYIIEQNKRIESLERKINGSVKNK